MVLTGHEPVKTGFFINVLVLYNIYNYYYVLNIYIYIHVIPAYVANLVGRRWASFAFVGCRGQWPYSLYKS